MTTQTNDISALREALFETLRGLKDGTVTPEQAAAINATGQVIINSAKVEVEALKIVGGTGTGFVPLTLDDAAGASQTPTGLKAWNGGVTVHKLRG